MSGASEAAIRLDRLLELVGELNDQQGKDTPRDRFRHFLETSVTSLGTVRDYVNVCLTNKGDQYDRTLQDLINHAGRLMEFEVEFGRYAGVVNDVGHDGLWKADGFSIVVEVKTTDAFSIKTGTLLGYINSLIDAGRIKTADTAMGLYVFGKPVAEMGQLEASILQAGHAQRLRIATVDDILSVAELVQQKMLTRDEALTLLRPVGVRVGSTVQLLKRIAAGMPPQDEMLNPTEPSASTVPPTIIAPKPSKESSAKEMIYLLTPVSSEDGISAEETIRSLLDQGVYVFGNRTAGRKDLKPGDKIAFYESGKGVVASANIKSVAVQKHVSFAKDPEKYPWAFDVDNVRYFFDDPVLIDASLRIQLDAFAGKPPEAPWSWFVQRTKKVSEHDYKVLTRTP